MLLNSEIVSAYWFFLPLLSIYIAIPFLVPFVENKSYEKLLWYMAGLSFVLKAFLPIVCRLGGIKWNGDLDFLMIGGYLIFPILGYLLANNDIAPKVRKIIYVSAFAGIAERYFMTVEGSVSSGSINNVLFDYRQFHSVLLACAVFLLFKYRKWKMIEALGIDSIIPQISACSLGIYLIHMIVIHYEKVFLRIGDNSWKWRIFGPFLTYIICLVFVYIVKKIPGFKRIFP